MKKKPDSTARYELDTSAMPPLTAMQKKELDALAAMTDEDIDASDIPSAAFTEAAERGRFYKPKKMQITARVDADVLAWLKSLGRGYQGRMNAILRREMLTALKRKKSA
jgi:uncharacterized protein (DUF4415 family)